MLHIIFISNLPYKPEHVNKMTTSLMVIQLSIFLPWITCYVELVESSMVCGFIPNTGHEQLNLKVIFNQNQSKIYQEL